MPRRKSNAPELTEQILKILEKNGLLAKENTESALPVVTDKISQLLVSTGFPESEVQTKQVTILLSDIRGFSSIANSFPPKDVVALLNRYFKRMGEIIASYGGRIDKLMGDSIMVVFGLPKSKSDDTARAIACSVEMQLAMSDINDYNQSIGMPDIYMGIGINTGEVLAGELGCDHYNEYTVIGDEVNLVSRIESHSLRGQVLISDSTYQYVSEIVEVSEPNKVEVKGAVEAVNLYEVFSISQPAYLEVPRREVRKSPRVATSMALTFQTLSGKIVQPEKYEADVLDISYNGMMVESEIRLPAMSEIKMSLALELFNTKTTDVYARIIHSSPSEQGFRSSMEFTSINREGLAAIKLYVDQLIAAS